MSKIIGAMQNVNLVQIADQIRKIREHLSDEVYQDALNGLYKMATDESYAEEVMLKSNDQRQTYDTLVWAFEWVFTDEGAEFWNYIDDKIKCHIQF